jgi:MFS family permease
MPKIRKDYVVNRKNIYLMYAIVLLQGMVFYGPIATLYRQASGLSVFQITLIESISYILCILFELPWGILADKIGYRKTMYFCCSLYFVSKLVFWRADGFASFLLERILLSVVIAGLSGVDTSVLYLSCDKGESQKVFGIYNSLGTVGLLAASFIFSVFVGDNYRTAALLTAISYGLAAILSFFLSEVKNEETQKISSTEFQVVFSQIVKNKSLILFLIAVAFMTQTHQTITVFLNQIQYEKCGMSAQTIGFVYIVITLAGMLGVFSDRITRAKGIKHTGIFFYIVAFAACFLLGFTDRAIFSVCGVLLLNLTNSLFQPFQLELQNKQVLSSNRATELSIYAIIIDSICAGTSVLFGTLTKVSLEAAFLFGAALSLVGLALFMVGVKR